MTRIFSLVLLALVLGGCQTKQLALDEAGHGVMLISELENSLTEFRRIETHSLNTRAKSLLAQKNALAEAERVVKRDMRTRAEVGDRRSATSLATLLASTEALAAEDAAYIDAAARNEALVAALITPLPTTKGATSAAQAALVDLGKELDGETRRREFLDFWKGVKASVDDAKQKIADAEAAASPSNIK